MSLVSLPSYTFSQNKVLFWINNVQQMHHGPSKVLWYWLQKDKTKTSIHIQTFGKWLNLCLWNSNFVWGKDMRVKYTVDLICLLAFVENLRAVTKQKLVRQYSKIEFLLMPLFTYTVKMQQQSLPKTYLRMFQQEKPQQPLDVGLLVQ